jgi:hypothetical protein
MIFKSTSVFLLSILFVNPAISSANELAGLKDIFPHVSHRCLIAYIDNAPEPDLQSCISEIGSRLKERKLCENEGQSVWFWNNSRGTSFCLKRQNSNK